MFDSDVSGLDASATLAGIELARAAAMSAEVQQLRLAAHWADLHATLRRVGPVIRGSERLVQLGGDGTPSVAEFAPAELGLALETSTHAAEALVADALDLRHRLPRLWERIQAGEVKPWIARKAAQLTHGLDQELAGRVDAVIARYADRLSWGRLETLILATWKRLDPAGAATAERLTRDELGVWLNRDRDRDRDRDHGVATLFARLEVLDGLRVDAAVQRGADALRALGDTRREDSRRAAALGVLADPQDALDLYTAHAELAAAQGAADEPPHHLDDTDDHPEPCRGEAVHPDVWRRPRRFDTAPRVMLYVHLSEDAIRTGQGVARVEDVGPITA
jgi:hypothetical protein